MTTKMNRKEGPTGQTLSKIGHCQSSSLSSSMCYCQRLRWDNCRHQARWWFRLCNEIVVETKVGASQYSLRINLSPLKDLIVVWLIVRFVAHNSMHTTSQCTYILQVNTYSIYHIHSVSITMVHPNLTCYHTSWVIYILPMNYVIHATTQLFSKSF